MAGYPKFGIPHEMKDVLLKTSALSEDDFDLLCTISKNAQPRLDTETFAREIATKLNNYRDVSEDDTTKILEMAIQSARASFSYGNREQEILESLLSLVGDEARIVDLDALRRRIAQLMNIDAVALTSIAGPEMVSHNSVLTQSKITTDIRPLFIPAQNGGDSQVKASVLVHQLLLRTRTNHETNDIFVALDDQDLLQLKQTIEEAIRKSFVLRSTELSAGRIPINNL